MTYLAVIGDVVGSRSVPGRASLQGRLKDEADLLSQTLRDDLAGQVQVLRGDEVQSLLIEPAQAVEIVRAITDRLHPIRMAFGLGWGEITTPLSGDVSSVDGPCFHWAREAVEHSKKSGRWVSVRGFGDRRDGALDALFGLLDAIRSGWTDRQAHIASLARGQRQVDVATELDVSKSVVSESLKAASFETVLAGEAAAKIFIGEFVKLAEPQPWFGKTGEPG